MRLTEVDSTQISVVIQGPTCRGSQPGSAMDLGLRAVQSIRTHLPQAEIIISTWQNDSVEGLGDCTVVRSADPGGMPDINGHINNLNRQLVSTRAGILAATRPYVLKFRADHALVSSKIATLGEFDASTPVERRLFSRPLTITNLYVRKATRYPFLFHPSDLVQFGCRDDLLSIWEGELFTFEDIFLRPDEKMPFLSSLAGYTNMRYVPEQSLLLRVLQQRGLAYDFPYMSYVSKPSLELWETLLASNFVLFDWQNSGVVFPTRFTAATYAHDTVYTEQDLDIIRVQLRAHAYRSRYGQVLLNKYLLMYLTRNGLVPLMANILFRFSPKLAVRVRAVWKKIMGTVR